MDMNQLRRHIKESTLPRLMIFHGEESYLRESYLTQIKQALLPEGLDGFNLDELDGKRLDFALLRDAAWRVPMMSERRLVIVTDYELYASGGEAERLIELLEDLPESVCLIFNFDLLAYKPDGRTKHTQRINRAAELVEFPFQQEDQLIRWVRDKHCRSMGKSIGYAEASRLIFLCGFHMQTLKNEVQKLAAYAPGDTISMADIDAVVIPVVEAHVFDLTGAIAAGQARKAMEKLVELTALQVDAFELLGVITRNMLQLYTARLLIENHRKQEALTTQFGIKSYPAKLAYNAARQRPLSWFRHALTVCYDTDAILRSGGPTARERSIELLLARLFIEGGAA